MKFVTVSQKFFELCKDEPELLFRENRRPHLLVLTLQYKGKISDFAVPLRSNISATTPKNQYFALPPRPSTRPGNRHGIHYIKMFPIKAEYQEKFWMGANSSYTLFQNIINKHQTEIISACQHYLNCYAAGVHPKFCVDIDRIFEHLNEKEGGN